MEKVVDFLISTNMEEVIDFLRCIAQDRETTEKYLELECKQTS
jgi:hypothetical protein